jgi:hypothetical protein
MSSVQNGASCGIGNYGMAKHGIVLECGDYSMKIYGYRFFMGFEFTNSFEGQQNGNSPSVDLEAFPRGVYFQQPEWTARSVLFPVGFFGDLSWSGRSSDFDYFQPRNVSYYAISQTLGLRINQISKNSLVRLVIGCELVRIARNQLPGDVLDGRYPNLTHSNTPEDVRI